MEEVNIVKEFDQLKPFLLSAQLGSYVVLPLKYKSEELDQVWLRVNGEKKEVTTANLTEQAKALLTTDHVMQVGECYEISRENFIRGLLDQEEVEKIMGFAVTDAGQDKREPEVNWEKDGFDVHSVYLYVFRTGVAFLCMGLRYSRMDVMAQICNLGSVDSQSQYYYLDNEKKSHKFSLDEKLKAFFDKVGVDIFYRRGTSMFLDAFGYNVAMIGRRFRNEDTMRQVTCNQNGMIPLAVDLEEDLTGALRYLYGMKDREQLTYSWGASVSEQAVSYIIADYNLDMEGQMKRHAEDGLPAVILALYEKFTATYLTEQAAREDTSLAEKQGLKEAMMNFQAFGTIRAMNLSKNYDTKVIYQHLLDMNGIEGSVNDLDKRLNVINEQLTELTDKRTKRLVGLAAGFCGVSMLASLMSVASALGASTTAMWAVPAVGGAVAVLGGLVALARKFHVGKLVAEQMEHLYDKLEAAKESIDQNLKERAEARAELQAEKEAEREAAEKEAIEKEAQQIIHMEEKKADVQAESETDHIMHA